jgi:hypothetical protein
MKDRTKMYAILGAGLLIYCGYSYAAFTLDSHFWTDRTISQEVPWYYLGKAVVNGACATVALLLVLLLGLVAKRILGKQGWPMLFSWLGLLAMPIAEGLSVLLFTRRIWAGPAEASTSITTFEQYMHVTSVASYLALACFAVLMLLYYRKTKAARASTSASSSEYPT